MQKDYKLLENLTVFDNLFLSGNYTNSEILQVLEDLNISNLKNKYSKHCSKIMLQFNKKKKIHM